MYSYVARQPVLDANKELFAYELLFRDGRDSGYPELSPDEAASKLLTQNHLQMGIDELTNGKLAFINFHEDALLHHFPTSLPAEHIYVGILNDVPISDQLIIACQKLKSMGYKLALDDHNFDEKWDVFLPIVDMIKIDIRQTNILKINKYLRHLDELHRRDILLMAERVETAQEYEQLKLLGFHYFQGYFFAKPEVVKQKSIAPNKLILMELISESSKKRMNINKISQLVERDVSLSYKLLRFINSSAFKRSQVIGSLKHALAYMGEKELKKFISLIALANLCENKPSELINLSVIRARFCAQLSEKREDDQDPPMAFLTGLFSLVDAILDQDLAAAIEKVPICPEIRVALTEQIGDLATYLKVAICYEKGQWKELEQLCADLGVGIEDVGDFYLDALQWANGLEEGNL